MAKEITKKAIIFTLWRSDFYDKSKGRCLEAYIFIVHMLNYVVYLHHNSFHSNKKHLKVVEFRHFYSGKYFNDVACPAQLLLQENTMI